jgi:hypothetical protein
MKEFITSKKLKGAIRIRLDEERVWVAEKAYVVHHIIKVVESYQAQGYKLTLRQLYYQLVAADYIPNHDKVYKKLSGIVNDVKYSGLINWDAIEDRGRVPHIAYSVANVQEAIDDAASYFRLDRQRGQEVNVEVWTEKDAISAILKRVTNRYGVRLVVNKGYTSSTAMYQSYCRFIDQINEGKKVRVLYFGDHDPSGLDMVRDIKERIIEFICKGGRIDEDKMQAWWEAGHYVVRDAIDFAEEVSGEDVAEKLYPMLPYHDGHDPSEDVYDLFDFYRKWMWLDQEELFEVVPVGLTMQQINTYNPPPNPAKIKDPRAKWYIRKFGAVSWEVDALKPQVMTQIITEAVEEVIDVELYRDVSRAGG